MASKDKNKDDPTSLGDKTKQNRRQLSVREQASTGSKRSVAETGAGTDRSSTGSEHESQEEVYESPMDTAPPPMPVAAFRKVSAVLPGQYREPRLKYTGGIRHTLKSPSIHQRRVSPGSTIRIGLARDTCDTRSRPSALTPCGTDDCLLHALFLKRHLNATSDPCDNLYAYVCGGSLGHHHAAAAANETMEHEVMRLYAEDLARDAHRRQRSATEGPPLQPSAENAVASLRESAAFQMCLERSSKEPQGFAQFMRERGIPWPRGVYPDGGAAAKSTILEVLFDLTVNWKVSLWFDLRVFRSVGNATTLMVREPGPLVTLRREQLRGVESLADYSILVRRVAAFLQKDGGPTLTDDDITDLYEKDTSMRSTLDAFSDDSSEDELLTLKKIAALAALNVTSLLTVLGKHLPANDDSLQDLSTKRMLDLIGWTFAYTYVWTVNPDFDRLSPRADDDRPRVENVDNRTLCFHAVQESFGLLRIARSLEDQDAVPNFLTKVADVARCTLLVLAERILQSDVISNVSKRTAADKVLQNVPRSADLPAALQDVGLLDSIYAMFPDTYRWRSRTIRYLSSINTLLPRIAALYPPSHYPHGSVTMSYAGLGFQVAENMIGAIVDHGRGVDDTGSKRFWWSASERCQWDQAPSAEEKAHVRRRFALRIATEALQRNVAGSSQDAFVQLKSMEQMSGRQTFYASFCSHFCGAPDGEATCNVALDEGAFQDAFGCRWWWSKFKSDPTCLIV
ncbi:hypothetical protein MTO96_051257 [Rhipicephalus appendiculatus]